MDRYLSAWLFNPDRWHSRRAVKIGRSGPHRYDLDLDPSRYRDRYWHHARSLRWRQQKKYRNRPEVIDAAGATREWLEDIRAFKGR
jgi:hypothetical protein